MELNAKPLYLQVVEIIEKRINDGIFKEAEKLPSEDKLSKQLGVSRATLREALRVLEDEKIIVRKHGIGTFVNTKPIFSSGIEKLNSITDMIVQSGKEPGTIFKSIQIEEPSKSDVKRFSLNVKEKILKIERIRTANDEAIVFCIDKIPSRIISNEIVDNIRMEDSIFKLLEKYADKKITYANANIEAVNCSGSICEDLNNEKNKPLLQLKQMHFNELNEPLLYSVNYFKTDYFKFNILRKRFQ